MSLFFHFVVPILELEYDDKLFDHFKEYLVLMHMKGIKSGNKSGNKSYSQKMVLINTLNSQGFNLNEKLNEFQNFNASRIDTDSKIIML